MRDAFSIEDKLGKVLKLLSSKPDPDPNPDPELSPKPDPDPKKNNNNFGSTTLDSTE